jgi:hypothetical protein
MSPISLTQAVLDLLSSLQEDGAEHVDAEQEHVAEDRNPPSEPARPDNPQLPFSDFFCSSLSDVKTELKKVFSEDDIASMTGTAYEAMLNVTLLRLLERTTCEKMRHQYGCRAKEILTLHGTNEGQQFDFSKDPELAKKFKNLHKLLISLSPKQVKTAQELLCNTESVLVSERDKKINDFYNAIVDFRIQTIEQDLMHAEKNRQTAQKIMKIFTE